MYCRARAFSRGNYTALRCGNYGCGGFLSWRALHVNFRPMPAQQLYRRAQRKPGRVRAAVPPEICALRGRALYAVCISAESRRFCLPPLAPAACRYGSGLAENRRPPQISRICRSGHAVLPPGIRWLCRGYAQKADRAAPALRARRFYLRVSFREAAGRRHYISLCGQARTAARPSDRISNEAARSGYASAKIDSFSLLRPL